MTIDWRADLEAAVNASTENPIVFAFDHPGGFMTTCRRSYRVIVHVDGTVDFWGWGGTRQEGAHHWTMPRARIDAILRKFEPLWDAPLEETYDVVDAGPNCLFVASGERRLLKCFIGWREGAQRFSDFANYLVFKTNTVQWLGEFGENRPECRERE